VIFSYISPANLDQYYYYLSRFVRGIWKYHRCPVFWDTVYITEDTSSTLASDWAFGLGEFTCASKICFRPRYYYGNETLEILRKSAITQLVGEMFQLLHQTRILGSANYAHEICLRPALLPW